MEASDSGKKAKETFKKGMKELETGFFKRKPDYVSAVGYFEEAGKLFKIAKMWKDSIVSYEQAIICNDKMNDPWAVARNKEAIINLIVDQDLKGEIDNLIQSVKSAGTYFKAADSYTESLKLYIKVSKYMVQYDRQSDAVNLMIEALNDADESGKKYNKSEVLNYALELMLKTDNHESAIQILDKEIKKTTDIEKNVFVDEQILVVTILCLILKQEVRAEELLNKYTQQLPAVYKSNEYQTASQLLDYYNEGEQEKFDALVNKHPIKQLYPPDIVKQIKKAKVKKVNVIDTQNLTDDQKVEEINKNLELLF